VKWSKGNVATALSIAVGALLISLERAPLAKSYAKLVTKHDVYVLPPAEHVVTLSLGYRSALADLIFGHLLVAAGIHTAEKRRFEYAAAYLEAINELDPKFRAPYRFADAIITLQTVAVPEQSFRDARQILLRGTRELPYDQELWSSAGQFLAYLAPGQLKDQAEQARFRQEGARLLSRACELLGQNENVPHHCISAAALFSKGGNVAAERAFWQRVLVVSDDPEQRVLAEARLRALDGVDAEQELVERSLRFEQLWRSDLPFVSRMEMTALGPRFDAARCAGRLGTAPGDACTTSFRERLAKR
jgi:hypothetical protein